MKVWVVMADYGYEGYGEPAGAYSSRELAEAAVKTLRHARSSRSPSTLPKMKVEPRLRPQPHPRGCLTVETLPRSLLPANRHPRQGQGSTQRQSAHPEQQR